MVDFKPNVEEALGPGNKTTYEVVYKIFIRELREYFRDDFHDFFGERRCKYRALKFPFKVIIYVSSRFDKRIIKTFFPEMDKKAL
jgi:hypothetical protein